MMRWPAELVRPVLACAFRCLARMHCHHTCCFRPLPEVDTPGVLHSIMLATWAQPMCQCQNQRVIHGAIALHQRAFLRHELSQARTRVCTRASCVRPRAHICGSKG